MILSQMLKLDNNVANYSIFTIHMPFEVCHYAIVWLHNQQYSPSLTFLKPTIGWLSVDKWLNEIGNISKPSGRSGYGWHTIKLLLTIPLKICLKWYSQQFSLENHGHITFFMSWSFLLYDLHVSTTWYFDGKRSNGWPFHHESIGWWRYPTIS